MKNIYCALLLLLCIGCNSVDTPREGDIIFQRAINEQSELIELVTESTITHCGIIVERDSAQYVLNVDRKVTLSPLQGFINHGANSEYTLMRATNKEVKIDLKKYMLAEYDYQMKFDNNRYYNAELVYEIYKNDLGIELCQPRPIKEYNIKGLEGMLSERRIEFDRPIVAPIDLYNSEKLKTYKTQPQVNKEKLKNNKK
ncbi:MAG: hypothetical protein J6L03_00070 [Bacteroidaceae bacterium]|nr:hypothetical protein [Bacteroidaceae bacterium]